MRTMIKERILELISIIINLRRLNSDCRLDGRIKITSSTLALNCRLYEYLYGKRIERESDAANRAFASLKFYY